MQNQKKKIQMSFRFAAVIATIFFIQTQFGCSLMKSVTSDSPSGNSTSSGNQTSSDNGGKNTTMADICRNSYYPVGANVNRKYHIKYQKMSNLDQDYTETYSGFGDANFVSNTSMKDVNTAVNWRCLPEGLLATQYGNEIDFKSGGGAKVETVNSEGISFPADTRWNPGEKWTTKYEITESMKNQNGQTGNVEAKGTVNQNGEIIGAEEVTVPAGTFQTMKVKVLTQLDLTINANKMTIPVKTKVETTAWFAKDVGMVKSIGEIGGLDSGTTELLSYTGTK